MPILVVDYDPAWPATFEALRATIWPAVADVAIDLEHVGSTSVPGLAAKPVIDLDLIVATDADVPVTIERLAGLGYRHLGNLGITGREAFARPDGSVRHNLYVCPSDSLGLRNHLAVRERLRSDPAARLAYGELKRRLGRETDDIDAYVEGKTELIVGWLADAGLRPAEQAAIEAQNRAATAAGAGMAARARIEGR
jgi:GrpB-like predicted nucleotidyltransferase (UPF0157 family)